MPHLPCVDEERDIGFKSRDINYRTDGSLLENDVMVKADQ